MIVNYAWTIPFVMAVSAMVIVAVGKRLPLHGAEIGIVTGSGAMLVALGIARTVFTQNEASVTTVTGPGFVHETSVAVGQIREVLTFHVGQRVDGLSSMMLVLVTAVALLVQIYSVGYMRGQPRVTYYVALLNGFTAAMTGTVIANNMVQLLVGWELVGVFSFLLIGFYWEKERAQRAAQKAFLTTKFGDVGIVLGTVGLWGTYGTFNITELLDRATESTPTLTLLTLAVFIGAIGKSAQFPLFTWLPDAMVGPTPVSALIHAATMVTAGVFVVARLYPLFVVSPVTLTVITVVGTATLVIGAFAALVQRDVKRMLAYSTISQLGYMVVALAFSYTAGVFHLFTHGFFKALLFLASGCITHITGTTDITEMGAVRRRSPTVFVTWVVAAGALAGVPPLAGFWSKDEVLAVVFNHGGTTGYTVGTLGMLGAVITALYIARATVLIFFDRGSQSGVNRWVASARSETTLAVKPHRVPSTMTVSTTILAVVTGVVGLAFTPWTDPAPFAVWTMLTPSYVAEAPHTTITISAVTTLLSIAGIVAGWVLYRRYETLLDDPLRRFEPVGMLLRNGLYLDRFNTAVAVILRDQVAPRLFEFDRQLLTQGFSPGARKSTAAALVVDRLVPAATWIEQRIIDRTVNGVVPFTLAASRVAYRVIDRSGIDSAVNGVATVVNQLGGIVRRPQSGQVQNYIAAMLIGVVVLAAVVAFATQHVL